MQKQTVAKQLNENYEKELIAQARGDVGGGGSICRSLEEGEEYAPLGMGNYK